MKHCKQHDLCWIFYEKDSEIPWQNKAYRFDFSFIRSKQLRREIQQYMWHHCRAGSRALATLRQELSWFHYYERWLYELGISSLKQIREADAEGFLTYLHTCVSGKTNRPLRLITQKHIYDTVRGIYRWYAGCDFAYEAAYRMFPTNVYQRINRIVRTAYATEEQVKHFLYAIEQTDNPCLRCGGVILVTTGMTPMDLLNLRTDCIQSSKDGNRLCYYHHRMRKFRMIPACGACVQAVQELKERTDELRQKAAKEQRQQLFLYCNKRGQVVVPSPDLFRYWMRQVPKQKKVQGEISGDTLTCTMLRYALMNDMQKRQMTPMLIHELTGYSLFVERGSIA